MTAATMLDALERATNAHDLDALVACFTADYVNETPAHPARGFRGREQVRANWRRIFAGVPDLPRRCCAPPSTAPRCGASGRCGTRRDGAEHLMRA